MRQVIVNWQFIFLLTHLFFRRICERLGNVIEIAAEECSVRLPRQSKSRRSESRQAET